MNYQLNTREQKNVPRYGFCNTGYLFLGTDPFPGYGFCNPASDRGAVRFEIAVASDRRLLRRQFLRN